MDEWRIVAVRDQDERARRVLNHRNWCEHRARKRGRLENRGFHRHEHLQIDGVIAVGLLDRDALMLNARRRMRREVRMHRRRVVVVVLRVDVRVQEGRAHRAALNGKRQPEREHAADHVAIVHQNRCGVF